MPYLNARFLAQLIAMALAVSAFAALSTVAVASPIDDRLAEDSTLDPQRVNWRQLDFKASKLFISAKTQVELAHLADGVAEISFDTQALGRKTTDAIRFRLADATTQSRHKQKHGSSPYAKVYRFGEGKVTMERAEPADVDEATGSHETWSHRSHETFDAPPGVCREVVDPSVVLYLAAARTWNVGSPPFRVCTFSDGRFSRLVVGVAGEEEIRVDYEIADADGVARTDGTVKALVLTLDAESLAGEGNDQLDVLGLEDDVRMYIDPATGAPLRFTGKMDHLGRVEVELQRLVLR